MNEIETQGDNRKDLKTVYWKDKVDKLVEN